MRKSAVLTAVTHAARRLRFPFAAVGGCARAARSAEAVTPREARGASAAGGTPAASNAAPTTGHQDRQHFDRVVSRELGADAHELVACATNRLERRGRRAHVRGLRRRGTIAAESAQQPHRPRDGQTSNRGPDLRRDHRAFTVGTGLRPAKPTWRRRRAAVSMSYATAMDGGSAANAGCNSAASDGAIPCARRSLFALWPCRCRSPRRRAAKRPRRAAGSAPTMSWRPSGCIRPGNPTLPRSQRSPSRASSSS